MGDADPDREPVSYIWKGFYLNGKWDRNQQGRVYSETKETAQELVTTAAEVDNDGWQQSPYDDDCYQINDSERHIVTVVKEPVYE